MNTEIRSSVKLNTCVVKCVHIWHSDCHWYVHVDADKVLDSPIHK